MSGARFSRAMICRSRSRHVAQPGNVGVVLDAAFPQQLVEANGQGHEPTDSRDTAGRWGRSGLVPDGHALTAVTARESALVSARTCLHHCCMNTYETVNELSYQDELPSRAGLYVSNTCTSLFQ